MRGKIQLTICKHKKAVGNEKKSKNKQNRQGIHESMTFDWHCYCGSNSINMSKHTLQVLHRLLAYQPVSTNRNGVNYMWTSNESGLWRLHNWPTTQIYTEEPVPSGNKVSYGVQQDTAVVFTSTSVWRGGALSCLQRWTLTRAYLWGRWLCWRGS